MSGCSWTNADFPASFDPSQENYLEFNSGLQHHGADIAPYGQHSLHGFSVTPVDQGYCSGAYGCVSQDDSGWHVRFNNPFDEGRLHGGSIGMAAADVTTSTQTPSSVDNTKDSESKADSPFGSHSDPPSPSGPRASVVDQQGLGRRLVARAGTHNLHKRKRSQEDDDTYDDVVDEPEVPTPRSLGPMSMSRAIPPRPKPGRKPAADQPVEKRKAQNREAQRQFRHRKNEQADDLKKAIETLKAENKMLTASLHRETMEHRFSKKSLEKIREEKQKAESTILELSQRLSTHLDALQQYQTGVSAGFQPSQPMMDQTQQMLDFAQEHTRHPEMMAVEGPSMDLVLQNSMTHAEFEAMLTSHADRLEVEPGTL